ncbi:hypothetical protein HV824_11535 [Myxococcus sp. AM009]|uniref:hypothetical protein n=1 Tax=unclassified Myxococcus TaxID=2648731 RepID=UPI0015951739|nr:MULTISPECIES: hypothetical protein [unclassified Myxococcus]NVI98748.1 hypothetical protein [Myxococcus sp. AM009]NVJ15374.1 hypothetical protein [Myxococcus sp. AM010]
MQAFNRWMVLGAVAVAMSVTGCREQNRDQQGTTTTPGMEGTGGSGQDTAPRPMDDMGGTGQEMQGMDAGTGGSGMMEDGYDAGTGGSGRMEDDRPMDTETHSPEGQQ